MGGVCYWFLLYLVYFDEIRALGLFVRTSCNWQHFVLFVACWCIFVQLVYVREFWRIGRIVVYFVVYGVFGGICVMSVFLLFGVFWHI